MRLMMSLMTAVALGVALTAAQAKNKAPDATLRLSGRSAAAGVGVTWGSGTLTYKGKHYPVEVNGLTVGDLGITSVEASGKVYNLKSLRDFDGNYAGVTGGVTAGGGAVAAAMKNQHGVTVELVSTTRGVAIALGGDGVDLKIKR